MSSKKTLKELVSKKQILAPCVWDCMSARIAQECGYEAILLSGHIVADYPVVLLPAERIRRERRGND